MPNLDFLVENVLKDIKKPKNINENVLDMPRKILCPEIWGKDEKIISSVKREILRRFDKWHEKVAPELPITHRYILGSITTFQYNDSSDFDVNFLTSWPKAKIDRLWTTLPNGHLLRGHPVNFYISANTHDIDQSKSLYDLDNDTWVKHPSKNNIEIPTKYSLEIAKFFMDAIDLRFGELDRDNKELEGLRKLLKNNNTEMDEEELKKAISDKEEEVTADIDSLKLSHYIIKGIRKEGFDETDKWKFAFGISINQDNDPNKSINNLIYKQLEQFGYFEKLEKIEKEND